MAKAIDLVESAGALLRGGLPPASQYMKDEKFQSYNCHGYHANLGLIVVLDSNCESYTEDAKKIRERYPDVSLHYILPNVLVSRSHED